MKKFTTVILSLSLIVLFTGPAMAVPYLFEDRIDDWDGYTHANIPQNTTYTYRHNVNDDVKYEMGHMVTEASLILSFDYIYNGKLLSMDYDITWEEQADSVFINLEKSGSWKQVRIRDGEDITYDLAIDWLNDDGFLDVALQVSNSGQNALGFLNYSIIRGVADDKVESVPEPATMFLLGAGLMGVAVVSRKRA